MPVPVQTPIQVTLANGISTVFPYAYTVLSAGDVVVTGLLDGVTTTYAYGTNYTLTGIGTDSGAVVFLVAPAAGTVITSYRDTALKRDTDYQDGGDLLAETLDADFDRIWLSLQEQASGGASFATTLRVPAGESIPTFGDVESRKNRFVAFDDSGNPVALTPTSGTGTALAIDLLNAVDPLKGPALVAFGPTVEYGANTVGAELVIAQAQCAAMHAKLAANQTDVFIFVPGDSTGNEPTEWVYLMAQRLGALYPTHDVKYRLWGSGDGSTQVWGAYSTVQTGTGATLPDTGQNTIWVDNCSVSGVNHFYAQGARESLIWTGNEYDLVISNYGHNFGTGQTEDIALPEFIVHLAHVRLMAPRAGLLVTLQNPRSSVTSNINTNGSAFSARMVTAWRRAADAIGAGVIDVYTAFQTAADYAGLMGDETHPNAAGQLVWVEEVMRVLAKPRRLTGRMPTMFNPLTEQRPNYVPNPRFSRWASSTPDGWAFTNCTPVKNVGVTDGTLYAMEVQIGVGVNPKITTDLTAFLPHLKGKIVTMVARIWRPSTVNLLTGRIAIETTDNVINPSFTSYPRGVPSSGGWEWAIATLMIPRNVSSAQLRIYAGAADGSDSGKSFYLDSIWFGEGVIPGAVGFEDITFKSVLDYYSDTNAGRFTGNTGTLTAVGGTLTLTGAPVGFSDTFINLPGLTAGKTYKVTFNATASTGNPAGGCYMRNGFDGGSTDLAKASGTGDWTAGGGVVTFTFVAPNGPVCIRPYGFTGCTGYVMTSWSVKPVESGITRAINLPLTTARNPDASPLAIAAAAGLFGISSTPGTSILLAGESATGNTKTSAAVWEVALPSDYIAGRDVTVTANAYAFGTGALGATKTLTLTAYRIADGSGVEGANLGPAASTLSTAATDFTMTVAGSTLSPGDRLLLRLTAVLQETGGVNPLTTRVHSLRLS